MNDDLISRKAAIDALHTWFRDGFEENRWWNSTHVLAALEGVPSAQTEPKWIPVTERLPEPYSGKYLVTINDGSIYTDILWYDSPGDGRYESCFYTEDDGYGIVIDDVTAWMPLPKPYKEKDDKEVYYTVSYKTNNGMQVQFIKRLKPSVAELFSKRTGYKYEQIH